MHMKVRSIVISLSWIVCLAMLGELLAQRQQILALKTTGSHPVATSESSPGSASQKNVHSTPEVNAPLTDPDASELLRLRSEITGLNARKRELTAALQRFERTTPRSRSNLDGSDRLIQIPPGYVRKKEAQPVGYATPENALQSFLWALQHHDITNVLRSLAPTAADRLSAQIASSEDAEQAFFKGTEVLPGMLVKDRKDFADGSTDVQIEVIPGLPPQSLHLRQINGEWKIEDGF